MPFRLSSEERRTRQKQRLNTWRSLLTLSQLLSEVNLLFFFYCSCSLSADSVYGNKQSTSLSDCACFRFCGWHHRASDNSQKDLPRSRGASQQEAGQPLEEARQHSSVKMFSTLTLWKGICIDFYISNEMGVFADSRSANSVFTVFSHSPLTVPRDIGSLSIRFSLPLHWKQQVKITPDFYKSIIDFVFGALATKSGCVSLLLYSLY